MEQGGKMKLKPEKFIVRAECDEAFGRGIKNR
jgi:hypothetical protein